MSASGQLDYEFFEGDEERVARVTYFYAAGRAANTRYGHPDTWSPAEPSEIDITEVDIDGHVLSQKEEAAFLAEYGDSVMAAIEAQETDEYGGW